MQGGRELTLSQFFVKDQGASNYKTTGCWHPGKGLTPNSLLSWLPTSCFLPRVNILKIFGLVEHEIFGFVNIVSTCKTDWFVMFYEFQGHTFSLYIMPKGLVSHKEEENY